MKAIKQAFVTLMVAIFLCLSVTTTAHAYAPKVEPELEVEEEIPLKPVGDPLTPDGNLSLVDDIITNNENDKQFITAVSKTGHYFYLVIDRAGDTDNVYLLNMVDEADLMALMYDEPVEVTYTLESQANLEEEPEIEEEVEEEPEPEEEEELEEDSVEKKGSSLPLLLAVIALAGGGFFYFKSKTKGNKGGMSMNDLDDEELDLDDDEL